MGDPFLRLHPLLRQRWSPIRFDAEHEVRGDDVDVLMEAARWAPSAGNSQPWAFIVGRRHDPVHERLAPYLAGSSAVWARAASLLVANLSHRFVEGTDWEFSEFSVYDLGQAVAHMTIQAHALGLQARQFRAFDRAGIAADFAVPEHWEVTSMTAFGRVPREAATPGELPAGSASVRERRPTVRISWSAER